MKLSSSGSLSHCLLPALSQIAGTPGHSCGHAPPRLCCSFRVVQGPCYGRTLWRVGLRPSPLTLNQESKPNVLPSSFTPVSWPPLWPHCQLGICAPSFHGWPNGGCRKFMHRTAHQWKVQWSCHMCLCHRSLEWRLKYPWVDGVFIWPNCFLIIHWFWLSVAE